MSDFPPALMKVRKMKKDNWSSINRIVSLMNIITQACEMNKVKLEFTKSDFLPVLIKVHKMNDRQLEL